MASRFLQDCIKLVPVATDFPFLTSARYGGIFTQIGTTHACAHHLHTQLLFGPPTHTRTYIHTHAQRERKREEERREREEERMEVGGNGH